MQAKNNTLCAGSKKRDPFSGCDSHGNPEKKESGAWHLLEQLKGGRLENTA